MHWEEYEILEREVLVVGKSPAFHFLIDHKDSPASRVRSACSNAESYHANERSTKEDPEEMVEAGKRPCKECIKHLKRFYDIDAKTCTLCDRLNLMTDINYRDETIPYAAGGEKTVEICLSCRSLFGMHF